MKLIYLFAQKMPTNCGEGESNSFVPGQTPKCLTNLPEVAGSNANLKIILGIVFGVAASVALISLVIAALNYATAATDSDKISRSRKAIIFSLVGLVIALSAEAIVLTVIDKL